MGGEGGADAGCTLPASCAAADKTCIGLVNNQGLTTFGLRMSELRLTSPTSLGTIPIANNVATHVPSCNLTGGALLSWLLQFDTQAKTLKTGGAKPVADPTQGYSFDSETLLGTAFAIAPATFNDVVPDSQGKFSVASGSGVDLVVPIFGDSGGLNAVLLPMHQVRFSSAALSSNNDCIGAYNGAGLDPGNACGPDDTNPQFLGQANVDGYITLEEADQVAVVSSNASLCVVLSGDSSMYGTPSPGPGHYASCTRDTGGKIVYQGGWCAATNAAATVTCADAVQVKGTFAASSVKILN
jgi:hypothetical protein